MNIYMVGKATAVHLQGSNGDEAKNRDVAIDFNIWNNSRFFARVTMDVLVG